MKKFLLALLLTMTSQAVDTSAQEFRFDRPPEFKSVEVSADRKITFQIHAPKATEVRLASSDLPGDAQRGLTMEKGENGVWKVTTEAVPSGAYRYNFSVDGLAVIDPRNPKTSESNLNTWSLVAVPGSDYSDLKDVPHGAVAQVTYHSKTLNTFRRMHVYTPPGYSKGTEQYPVLYLLHGAFDCDNSWSTVGQAGQILDNLLAAGKAKPMIVVMPMGHTGAFAFGPNNDLNQQMEDFAQDFHNEIRPYVEKNYRCLEGRDNRAIAGLSMGGAHTLDIAFTKLADFSYIGVFSSGIFGIDRPESNGAAEWMEKHKECLTNADYKKGLKLVWLATGREDFLLKTTEATVEALKKNGLEVVYKETDGGHTWLKWRDYLNEFAPQLFQ